MLTCSSEDGCKSSGLNWTDKLTENKQSLFSANSMSDCLKVNQNTFVASSVGSSYKCPGSAAWVYAWSEQTTSVNAGCDAVMKEVTDRVKGENGWYDPHNRGTYSITSTSADEFGLQRQTANGKYTDRIVLQFASSGGTCVVKGCSESQVTSFMDFSTNFCNIRMLTCGSEDGCKSSGLDWTDKLTENKQSLFSAHSMSDCLKTLSDSKLII